MTIEFQKYDNTGMATCSAPKPKILPKLLSVTTSGTQIGGLARISRFGRKADSTTQRPGTHMMTINRNVVSQRPAARSRFFMARLIPRLPYTGGRRRAW